MKLTHSPYNISSSFSGLGFPFETTVEAEEDGAEARLDSQIDVLCPTFKSIRMAKSILNSGLQNTSEYETTLQWPAEHLSAT
ncbi:hypothetical protein C4D60_Mb03t06080 [Musa balbisiana]|uniref:Uncharacterized protein n=1 Tax=Musa balbisiana TaxID=52838 RepID=A0A4S8JAB5_MUSBA|nr:hypothetical protein C4D60_Mb03t06080 [Musa balbisiana]